MQRPDFLVFIKVFHMFKKKLMPPIEKHKGQGSVPNYCQLFSHHSKVFKSFVQEVWGNGAVNFLKLINKKKKKRKIQYLTKCELNGSPMILVFGKLDLVQNTINES